MGHVALVTGAAQGLGRAMALALADAGAADIILVDPQRGGRAREPAETATRYGPGRRWWSRCDPTRIRRQIRCDVFGQFRMPRSHGLIIPGATSAGDGHFWETPSDRFPLEEVELVAGRKPGARAASFASAKEAGRRMLAAGRGSIVNIGSLASVTALGRGHIAYSMAMGAVAQMTRELRTKWAGRGVRGQRHPARAGGETRTGTAHVAQPALRENFSAGIPAGRLRHPMTFVAGGVTSRRRPDESWITGALIPIGWEAISRPTAGANDGAKTHWVN
jgi:NAD(P)-dependent dehydrogenase (short-subunit alcohol dehydrogenase family)